MSIGDLDDSVRERRVRAAEHGRSMEAEMRAILTDAVRERDDAPGLAGALLDRFGGSSGVGVVPRAAHLPS